MKKKLAVVLSLMLVAMFMMTACGGSKVSTLKDAYKDAGYTISGETSNTEDGVTSEIFVATKGTSVATITYASGGEAEEAISALESLSKLVPNMKVSVKEGKYLCVASDDAALAIFNDAF